jgi:hypothetical protein
MESAAVAPTRLADVAATIPDADVTTKPAHLWDVYERYLPPLRDQPIRLLELGIHKGVSARAFSRYFRNGTIVALDIALPDVEFAPYTNLHPRICDQRDTTKLAAISREFAPDGWDIIIDDASHIGHWSLTTFEALFPRLKRGGLYFVEDWATGYMDTPKWGDGALPTGPQLLDFEPAAQQYARQIATHQHGMAGFVKALVDRAWFPKSIFEWLNFHGTVVVAKKR